MNTILPEAFCGRMQKLLGTQYEDFLASYDQPAYRSLRINPLKKRAGKRDGTDLPFQLTAVPWSPWGYYYGLQDQPGRHPFHDAGVYYIQEASAMYPAVCLQAQPGERILDLCAAPGGKSTQIAADMLGRGLLVCNEIHPARARILSENIERMGIRNALVTNETPERLAERFPEYFDRILVDAPCSGEGMFRRQEEARQEWSPENVELCAARQDLILHCAAGMLRPGGRLVYSTCTFAPLENEGSVSRFLAEHPEYKLAGTARYEGMADGVPDWAGHPAAGLERTVRLWPHRMKGEGHYAAVFQKETETAQAVGPDVRNGKTRKKETAPGTALKEYPAYGEFAQQFLKAGLPDGILLTFGEQLYLAPGELPRLEKLKVLRPGLHLGTLRKNRFEPAHALALALGPEEAVHCLDLSAEAAAAYLRGETLLPEGPAETGEPAKGWHLIAVDGYSIGWGKFAGGIMKNHYPRGLRRNC